jgi:hypothetical protein
MSNFDNTNAPKAKTPGLADRVLPYNAFVLARNARRRIAETEAVGKPLFAPRLMLGGAS